MRIEPVSVSNPLADVRATNARALLRQPASVPAAAAGQTSSPAEETTSAEQIRSASVASQTAPLPQFPQNEVTVQFDQTTNDNVLIYQFLDKQSGDVFMQLPSTQVLSIVHQIQAEMQKNFAEQSAGARSLGNVKQGGPGDGN